MIFPQGAQHVSTARVRCVAEKLLDDGLVYLAGTEPKRWPAHDGRVDQLNLVIAFVVPHQVTEGRRRWLYAYPGPSEIGQRAGIREGDPIECPDVEEAAGAPGEVIENELPLAIL